MSWFRSLLIVTATILGVYVLVPLEETRAQDFRADRSEVQIPLTDGLKLKGEVLVPKGPRARAELPVVIFLNPFGQIYQVYQKQAEEFAQQGYLVVRFNPRGWHGSQGKNTLNYEQLTKDAQDVISWVSESYPVAPGKIGVTGISEGAGLALLLAAIEPRLGAVAALSSWTDFAHPSLGNTQRAAWSGVLLTFLGLFGNPKDLIDDLIEQLKDLPEGSTLADFQQKISPVRKLAAINAKATPILLSHNYDDTLFPVNQVIDFYQKLSGAKRLTIFPGFHASSEVAGILTQESGPWKEVKEWFASYLLTDTFAASDLVRVAIKNEAQVLDESSPEPDDTQYLELFAYQREAERELGTQPLPSAPLHLDYQAGRGAPVSTGIPVISPLLNLAQRKTVSVDLDKIRAPRGLVFQSEPQLEERLIFGRPRLQTRLRASSDRGMLIAHLLDVPANGPAQLITHGVLTWTKRDAEGLVDVQLEALAVAWRLPQGHRLALAYDMVDLEYAPANLRPYSIDFLEEPGTTRLTIPWIRRPAR